MDSRYSIKLNSDFRHIYSKGKSHVSPMLVIYCIKNKCEYNRIGYTVSTKLGHAVVRNRIKRQFREIYRLNSPLIVNGYDIIIVARHKCVGASYQKIEKSFIESCTELNLIKQ